MKHRDHSLHAQTRRMLLAGIAAFSLGLLSVSGMSWASEGMGHGHGHGPGHGGFMEFRAPDAATLEKHLDRMLDRIVPDITAAQKTSIKTIAKAAHADMKPMHEQIKTLRKAQITILTAATVDRNALEQNRVDTLRQVELLSKRKNQALADVADVLTAAQRAKVGEVLKARMEHKILPGAMKSPFGK
ncbi:periplasmic heavy metal sensor [Massilia sp. W12]|uniref:periplasmic heavy metal sensor n=1 Tax=Massilia sp. W12 TaxID=3126507 RepID=UPI0030D4703C